MDVGQEEVQCKILVTGEKVVGGVQGAGVSQLLLVLLLVLCDGGVEVVVMIGAGFKPGQPYLLNIQLFKYTRTTTQLKN